MTFIFKIIFYLFAIIFIVDKCRADRNKMKTKFVSADISPTDLQIRKTKRPHWDTNLYNHQWRPVHQSDQNYYHQVPINQNHLYSNRIQITMDFIQEENDYSETKDMLPKFSKENEDESNISSSHFGEVEERAATVVHSDSVVVPEFANCMPELTTVEIVHNDDPTVMYLPSCTRLERCGGCCIDSIYSCQPTQTESVKLQVVKTQLVGDRLKNLGRQTVEVFKHTKCQCQCKIKQRDCTSMQIYDKPKCKCICPNNGEERRCLNENADKLWNSDTCTCECREIKECSTGYSYDTRQCTCTKQFIGGAPHIPQERAWGLINKEDPKIPLLK